MDDIIFNDPYYYLRKINDSHELFIVVPTKDYSVEFGEISSDLTIKIKLKTPPPNPPRPYAKAKYTFTALSDNTFVTLNRVIGENDQLKVYVEAIDADDNTNSYDEIALNCPYIHPYRARYTDKESNPPFYPRVLIHTDKTYTEDENEETGRLNTPSSNDEHQSTIQFLATNTATAAKWVSPVYLNKAYYKRFQHVQEEGYFVCTVSIDSAGGSKGKVKNRRYALHPSPVVVNPTDCDNIFCRIWQALKKWLGFPTRTGDVPVDKPVGGKE